MIGSEFYCVSRVHDKQAAGGAGMEIDRNDRLLIDGELVTVVAASRERTGFNCVVKSPTQGLAEVFVLFADIPTCNVPRARLWLRSEEPFRFADHACAGRTLM